MSYISHSPNEVREMLNELGLKNIDQLFNDINKEKLNPEIKLPEPLTEAQAFEYMKEMASKNREDFISLLGAGSYDHYVPAIIDEISGRTEFYTAYTPYQPEVSQGTLQTIYEFQSLICSLTNMEVCNASMYDGGTALAEAILMAFNSKKKAKKVMLSSGINPLYREVVKTYLRGIDCEIVNVPLNKNGTVDIQFIKDYDMKEVCAICVQNPNFLGLLNTEFEQLNTIKESNKCMLIACVNPISQPVIKTGMDLGIDITVGEGQPLGMYMNYGGPYVGFLATTKKNMRKMPGRIVGVSTDTRGNRSFVLTLQAREQHIRRSKATSNICSNQALCATRATVFMSLLGKTGMRDLALLNIKRLQELLDILDKNGIRKVYQGKVFNEAVVFVKNAKKVLEDLKNKGIIFGLDLENVLGEDFKDNVLVCATEKLSSEKIAKIEQALKGALNE